ncbi:MAG TPA: hypothetical protein VF718_12705 [Allosphingosinicella sp.]|jgi:hypothetical protein
MKRHLLIALLALPLAATPALALTHSAGKVSSVYADPSDLVILMTVAGSCGSNFFHVKRSSANFREMTDVALTAYQTGRTLGLYVKSCEGDRNVLSHGYVTN